MFEDEASFGRISQPASCWVPPKCQPTAPSQRIREYKPVYGAVSPEDGESYFVVLEKCDSENMEVFLRGLAEKFPDELILLVMDQASYHTAKILVVPKNIECFYLPPRTPEMNPVEMVWREIRKRGFKNQAFNSLGAVISKFHEVVHTMSTETFQSVTCWNWISQILSAA